MNTTPNPKRMTPRERRAWIAQYIATYEPRTGVDVLHRRFVEAYVKATGSHVNPVAWGADKCRQLGADLSAMKRLGELRRFRIGLGFNWQPGFPKWVWSYELVPTDSPEENVSHG